MKTVGPHPALTLTLILCSLLILSNITSAQRVAADSPQTLTFQVNGKPYNFTLTTDSSSTTSPITRYSESKFNFTVAGTGTGWANATLCKTAGNFPPGQAKPQNTKIYLNGTKITNGTDNTILIEKIDPSQPVTCIWVYWTFHHSTNQFSMDLSLAVSLQAPVFTSALPILAISTLLVAQFAISRHRRHRQ